VNVLTVSYSPCHTI